MILATAIPQPAGHASGHLFTWIIFTIAIAFALFVILCCFKKGADIIEEEERIRRERRQDKSEIEKRNQRDAGPNQHANGKNHDRKN